MDVLTERIAPMDAVSLLAGMGNLFREMADVAAAGQAALADGTVSPEEARRVLRQLRDVFIVGGGMVARLQATIDAGQLA